MSFKAKLSLPTDKVIAYLIPNDWKNLVQKVLMSPFLIFIAMLKMQEK